MQLRLPRCADEWMLMLSSKLPVFSADREATSQEGQAGYRCSERRCRAAFLVGAPASPCRHVSEERGITRTGDLTRRSYLLLIKLLNSIRLWTPRHRWCFKCFRFRWQHLDCARRPELCVVLIVCDRVFVCACAQPRAGLNVCAVLCVCALLGG